MSARGHWTSCRAAEMVSGKCKFCHILLPVAASLIPGIVTAHHSVLAFDGSHGVELAGQVTRVQRINPHTQIALDVRQPDGSAKTWIIESESALLLARLGWEKNAIEEGDHITVIGAPAKDGSSTLRCQRIMLEDGRTLACYPGLSGLDEE